MIAAIWSTQAERMMDFPARTLFGFLDNHGLLAVRGKPAWRVIQGGSRRYVEKLVRPFADRARLQSPVRSITRHPNHVTLRVDGEPEERDFDRVILATHSDQALRLLAHPSPEERQILGAIPYEDSEVVLHTDERFLPRNEWARASWNYHRTGRETDRVEVTYSMNRLQSFEAKRQYCVTLNRTAEIDPQRILRRETLAHPQLDIDSEEAQARWARIDGANGAHFCGAYWGNGFHEDGVASAVAVARTLGVEW